VSTSINVDAWLLLSMWGMLLLAIIAPVLYILRMAFDPRDPKIAIASKRRRQRPPANAAAIALPRIVVAKTAKQIAAEKRWRLLIGRDADER